MVLGDLIFVKIGGKKLVAQQKCELNQDMEMVETTSKDSGVAKEFVPDKYSGTISVSGLYDPDASSSTYENSMTIQTAFVGKTLCQLKFGEIANGRKYFSCNAYIQSHNIGAPMGDVSTYDITFQITGAISVGTVSPD